MTEAIVVLFMLVLSFMMGVGAGEGKAERKYKMESVERGYASYNPTNGVWQWKEPKQ